MRAAKRPAHSRGRHVLAGPRDGRGYASALRQRRQAESWLRTRRGDRRDRAALYLARDRTPMGRVVGVFEPRPDGKRGLAYYLARDAAVATGAAMECDPVRVTASYRPDSGAPPTPWRGPFTWAILHCGSLDNRDDAAILAECPEVVASALAQGLRTYFAGATTGLRWRAAGASSRRAPPASSRVRRRAAPAGWSISTVPPG
ncbi:MAG: hypothetical protein WKH64_17530 [Chloroflexia bacterium]